MTGVCSLLLTFHLLVNDGRVKGQLGPLLKVKVAIVKNPLHAASANDQRTKIHTENWRLLSWNCKVPKLLSTEKLYLNGKKVAGYDVR